MAQNHTSVLWYQLPSSSILIMTFFKNRRVQLNSPFRCRKSSIIIVIVGSVVLSLCLRQAVETLIDNELGVLMLPLRNSRSSGFRRPIRILLWTKLYSQLQHWDWWFKQSFIEEGCPHINCSFTTDRSTIQSSDAVVFHGFYADLNASDLPKFRHPRQRWIFLLNESPHVPRQNLTPFNGLFNWTMTFRNDSDIFGGYGDIYTIPKLANPTYTVSTNYAAGKTKLIGWMVSHCKTKSRREDYVAELQKYVPVDIIGACGTLKCKGRDSDKCYREMESTYKFYLSFENSICPEYITEKFLGYLSYNVVPVVFGGPGHDAFAPKEAYIDALSFPSPRELASYLLQLDQNETLYNKFFDWKRGLVVLNRQKLRLNCELCQKVGDSSLPPKWYPDIDYWWNVKRECSYWQNGTFHLRKG